VIFVPTVVKRALERLLGSVSGTVRGFESTEVSGDVARLLADPAYELVPGTAVAQAIAALPPRALVTATCSPRGKIPATLDLTAELAAAGHRAIPHIAARLVADAAMLDKVAATLAEHGIADAFLIAGDAPEALGPYDGVLGLLPDLLAAAPHLERVGIAGYPDGHPLLDAAALRGQLLAKQAMLTAAGVAGWVSTQMCFDPPRVRSWLEAERAAGLTLPVRLGVPGEVDRGRLIRMGARLGVGASLRFASKQGGTIARLIAPGGYDPLHVVGALAPDAERLGIEGLHVFTFNSVAETVAWRDALLR
jgi:methylenetetrahydrofolate reductase (NADPH)